LTAYSGADAREPFGLASCADLRVFFQPEVGGLIALVQRFASVPLTVANQSLATMFHREAREGIDRAPSGFLRYLKLMFVIAAHLRFCRSIFRCGASVRR
jgi:hypothetical protein